MIWAIGVITMIADHVGALHQGDVLGWRIVGRISFPLFAWGVAGGMERTRDQGAYLWRLAFLAVPSEVIHYALWGYPGSPVSMLFVGALLLRLGDKWRQVALLAGVLTGQGAWVLPVAWAYEGYVPVVCLLLAGTGGNWVQATALLAIPIVHMAKDLPGPTVPRWAKYAIYPGHLLIMAAIRHL